MMKIYKINLARAMPLYLRVEAYSARQIQDVFYQRFGVWIEEDSIEEEE